MNDTTQSAPGGAPPHQPPRRGRLYRSRQERMLGGVCGGIAEHFGIDPVLVRLAVVALTLMGGSGLIAYAVAWIVIPQAPPHPSFGRTETDDRSGVSVPAIVLLVIGSVLLLPAIVSPGHHDRWGWRGPDGGDFLAPLILLGIGVYLLVRPRGVEPPPAPPPGWQPWNPITPTTTAPAAPSPRTGETSTDQPSTVDDAGGGGGDDDDVDDTTRVVTSSASTAAAATDASDETTTATDPGGPFEPVPPWWSTLEEPAPPEPPPPLPAASSRLLGIVLASMLIAGGLAWLLHASGAVDLDPRNVVAGGLLIVGIGVLAGAWLGRSWVLVGIGVVLAAALAVTARFDAPLEGGFGERAWEPQSLSQLQAEEPYRLIGGEAVLDLRELDLGGERVVVEASVTFGELTVLVPDDVTVRVDGRVTAGEIRTVVGRNSDGVTLRLRGERAGTEGAGTLVLDLRVGFGELELAHG